MTIVKVYEILKHTLATQSLATADATRCKDVCKAILYQFDKKPRLLIVMQSKEATVRERLLSESMREVSIPLVTHTHS